MKSIRSDARVLVASDNADDLTSIAEILAGDFADVRTSSTAAQAAADFEALRPHVVVLGFDSLEKAQRWVLALHRASRTANDHRHRTLLLCTKGDLHAAVELCRQGRFDDYVMHWPMSHDGSRLAMSVRAAARESLGEPRGEAVRAWLASVDGSADDAAPLSPEAAEATSREPRRIMVVDDDEVARVLIAEALAGEPYELVFAETGATALGVLRHTRPDLILMDIRLPDMDGVLLTGRLKALPQLASIPVLMLSGEAFRETLESSMQAGASGFIVKPFTRDALVSRVERSLALA